VTGAVCMPFCSVERSAVAPAPSSGFWAANAACQGRTELFFAPRAEGPEARRSREAEARHLCLSCPVLEPCQTWARRRREYGFWGGESEEERAAAGYPPALPVGRVARIMRSALPGPLAEGHAHPKLAG